MCVNIYIYSDCTYIRNVCLQTLIISDRDHHYATKKLGLLSSGFWNELSSATYIVQHNFVLISLIIWVRLLEFNVYFLLTVISLKLMCLGFFGRVGIRVTKRDGYIYIPKMVNVNTNVVFNVNYIHLHLRT